MGALAMDGHFGALFATKAFGYAFVYQIEVFILFATLIAMAPLVKVSVFKAKPQSEAPQMGLADFPT